MTDYVPPPFSFLFILHEDTKPPIFAIYGIFYLLLKHTKVKLLYTQKKPATDAETTKSANRSQRASKQSPPLSKNGDEGLYAPTPKYFLYSFLKNNSTHTRLAIEHLCV